MAWRADAQVLPASRFVFVDESSTTATMARRCAWAPHGARAVGQVPRNHGTATTLIAALLPSGLEALMTLTRAVDAGALTTYVRDVLCPALPPGQIVIMDNLSSHKGAAIEAL